MTPTFEDITLTLENDQKFYKKYVYCMQPESRESLIGCTCVVKFGAHQAPALPMARLLEYFDNRWHGELSARGCVFAKTPEKPLGGRVPTVHHIGTASANTTKEIVMPPKFFEEKKFLNGVDIATMSDDLIYTHIAAKEAAIKQQELIEHKPKSLLKKIEDGRNEIKSLIEYLDSKA
jgi:hypothetical protein